jgi:hypothetical protein
MMKKAALMFMVAGLVAVSQATLVDNFESYTTGNVATVANPPWVVTQNVEVPTIGQETDGNKYTESTGTYLALGANSIAADDAESTVFFRIFRPVASNPDWSAGVSHLANPTGDWGNYEAYIAIVGNNINARNNSSNATIVSGISNDTWYNIWLVLNNSANTYDVYVTTGTTDATTADLKANDFGFRNDSAASLSTFKIYGRANATAPRACRVDDINTVSGTNLTYGLVPEPATMLLLGLGGLAISFRKR